MTLVASSESDGEVIVVVGDIKDCGEERKNQSGGTDGYDGEHDQSFPVANLLREG